jgi:hypothetical protein
MKQKFDPTNLITYAIIMIAALTMFILTAQIAGEVVARFK